MSESAPDQPQTVLKGRFSADFRWLWLSHGVSRVGTEVTTLALPLLAVLTLNGNPVQLGALVAVEYVPSLVLGLIAGVYVDRANKRLLMLGCDLGRAALLLVIPILAAVNHLGFAVLYVVVACVGTLSLFFDISYQSLLPDLVEEDQLADANGKLEGTRSVAAAAGPALGGALVQAVRAPMAVLLDALSYLVSAFAVARLRPTPVPERAAADEPRPSVREDLAEGVRTFRSEPLQVRLLGVGVMSNFFLAAVMALFPLYVVRSLGLNPAEIGAAYAVGAIGGIVVAVFAGKLGKWLDPRLAIASGLVVEAIGTTSVVLVGGPRPVVLAVVCLSQVLASAGLVIVAASAMAWRMKITPRALLGRVISVARTVNFGVAPLGALVMGSLATVLSTRTALGIAAAGAMASALWLLPGGRSGQEKR